MYNFGVIIICLVPSQVWIQPLLQCKAKQVSKFESIPFYIYDEAIGDHLQSNLGIISRPGIICSSIWGSFPVRDHLRACTVVEPLHSTLYRSLFLLFIVCSDQQLIQRIPAGLSSTVVAWTSLVKMKLEKTMKRMVVESLPPAPKEKKSLSLTLN